MGNKTFVVFWVPVLLYAALILGVSSIPPRSIERLPFLSWDKAAHAIEYGIFSVVIARALRGAPPIAAAATPAGAALVATLMAAAWGALDENYQRLTGREPDPLDWIADVLGAGVVQVASIVVRARASGSRGDRRPRAMRGGS